MWHVLSVGCVGADGEYAADASVAAAVGTGAGGAVAGIADLAVLQLHLLLQETRVRLVPCLRSVTQRGGVCGGSRCIRVLAATLLRYPQSRDGREKGGATLALVHQYQARRIHTAAYGGGGHSAWGRLLAYLIGDVAAADAVGGGDEDVLRDDDGDGILHQRLLRHNLQGSYHRQQVLMDAWGKIAAHHLHQGGLLLRCRLLLPSWGPRHHLPRVRHKTLPKASQVDGSYNLAHGLRHKDCSFDCFNPAFALRSHGEDRHEEDTKTVRPKAR